MQTKPLADLGQDRHAQLAAAVRDHEVDRFGGRLFGGTNKIALVFAILGVDDNYDPPSRIASMASSIVEK